MSSSLSYRERLARRLAGDTLKDDALRCAEGLLGRGLVYAREYQRRVEAAGNGAVLDAEGQLRCQRAVAVAISRARDHCPGPAKRAPRTRRR